MLNLDSMNGKELLTLFGEINNHIRLSAKKYGLSVRDIKLIGAYAINKKVAMDERKKGNIEDAMKYEAICNKQII